jgi:hypothetical protein
MILKIKSNNKWIYYDEIDKVVDNGIHPIESNKIYYPDTNIVMENADATYVWDLDSDESGSCKIIEIVKYRGDDKSSSNRIIALQNAYLLNNEGKTIERL